MGEVAKVVAREVVEAVSEPLDKTVLDGRGGGSMRGGTAGQAADCNVGDTLGEQARHQRMRAW